jgi:hypothetical protein
VKPPITIRSGAYVYDVVMDMVACGALGATGATANDDLRIYMDDRRPPGVLRDTLLHECLHTIWKQTYLVKEYDDESSDSAGERIINELAPRLLLLLRDNPRLVTFLLESDR